MSSRRARVLVTRPRPEAASTVRRLEALGCEAVLAPVMEIAPLARAFPAEPPDALVATSANAFALPLPSDWLGLPVFTVGEATAAAARTAGLGRVLSAGGTAAALAATLLRDTAPDARLLLLAGRQRKPDLERALDGAMRRLQVVETYEARAVPWTEHMVADLRRSPPAAALHFSPRSARLAAEAATAAGLAGLFGTIRHVCLSADIAEALRPGAGSEPVIAARPDSDSLMQALRHILEDG